MRECEKDAPLGALVQSDPVVRSATAAVRFSRQAYQIVMALNSHLQFSAAEDAEQLAAFNAAPFGGSCCGLGFRVVGSAQNGWSGKGELNWHRGAPLIDGALLLAGRVGVSQTPQPELKRSWRSNCDLPRST